MNTFSAYHETYDPYDDYRGPYLEQLQELKDDKRVLISVYDAMKRRLEVADKVFSDEKVRNAWMRESFDTRDAIIHGPERRTRLVLDAFQNLDLSKAKVQRGAVVLPRDYWDMFTGKEVLELDKKKMEVLNKTIYGARNSREAEVWQFVTRGSNNLLDSYVGFLVERLRRDYDIMNIRFLSNSADNFVDDLIIRPLYLRHVDIEEGEVALTSSLNIRKNSLLIGMPSLELEAFLSQFRQLGQGRVPSKKWGEYMENVQDLYRKWFGHPKVF